jgi:uncharacterized membrane protein YhhN
MTKTLSLAYAFFAIVYLCTLAVDVNFSWLLKVLPIIILLIAVVMSSRADNRPTIFLALVFSACGDILLDFNFFIFGVGAFLLAQLSYAVIFLRTWQGVYKRWPNSIGLIAIMLLMLFLLLPNLGDLQIPVIAYLLAIGLMGVAAIQSSHTFCWAVLGAIIFIVSDSLIAVDKFVHPVPMASYWIMITYYLAQWMLVFGLLMPVLKLNRPN